MVFVKNNNVYVKLEGWGFQKKLTSLKDFGFRYNGLSKHWHAPKEMYGVAWQIDNENAFTKEENDEADIWYAEWEKSLLSPQLFEEPVHIKDYLLY